MSQRHLFDRKQIHSFDFSTSCASEVGFENGVELINDSFSSNGLVWVILLKSFAEAAKLHLTHSGTFLNSFEI